MTADKPEAALQPSAVAVEALKLHPLGSDRTPDEVKGWNAAIDHLHANGLLQGRGYGK